METKFLSSLSNDLVRAFVQELRRQRSFVAVVVGLFVLVASIVSVRINLETYYQGEGSIIFAVNYQEAIRPNVNSIIDENRLFDSWVGDEVFLELVNKKVVDRIGEHQFSGVGMTMANDRMFISYRGQDEQKVREILQIWTEEFVSTIVETFSRNSIDIINLERQRQEMEQRLTLAQAELEQFIARGEREEIKRQIDRLSELINAVTNIDRTSITVNAERLIRYEQLIRELNIIRDRALSGKSTVADFLSLIALQTKEFGSVPNLNLQIDVKGSEFTLDTEYLESILRSLNADYQTSRKLLLESQTPSPRPTGIELANLQRRLVENSIRLERLDYQYSILVRERDFARDTLFSVKDQIEKIRLSNSIPFIVRPVGVTVREVSPYITFVSARRFLLTLFFGLVSGFIVSGFYITFQLWSKSGLNGLVSKNSVE